MNRIHMLNQFINSICIDCFDVEVMMSHIGEALLPIHEDFKISRLEVKLDAPASPVSPNGEKRTAILFDSPNCDLKKIQTHNFTTGENGKLDITFYGINGISWDNTDIELLNTLALLIYTQTGKSRIGFLLESAIATDSDTHVPNMVGFQKFAHKLEAEEKLNRYSCIFMNIKNFRMFSKREGAATGDELIKRVNHQLSMMCDSEEISCRPGGDNCAMLVKKEHLPQILRVIESITMPLTKGGKTFDIHIDIWGGVYDIQPDNTVKDALERASIALSFSKKSRNAKLISFFTEDMMAAFIREKDILALFPIGILLDEFEVYYQPKADVRNTKLIGAEGLVRWNRKGHLISPADFIPVLEEDGQIIELDFYVFEKVCQDIRSWIDSGIDPVRISTNFSRDHFRTNDTAERILTIMRDYNISGDYIQIEITEMAGYDDMGEMMRFIKVLHSAGITVAIDDFGIGYSSLNMLKDYEADIVKIDKSLLDDVRDNVKAQRLLEFIIKISREIGMDVIVEGVEQKDQFDYVSDIGCNFVQGYYFDKPLPKGEFEGRLLCKEYSL